MRRLQWQRRAGDAEWRGFDAGRLYAVVRPSVEPEGWVPFLVGPDGEESRVGGVFAELQGAQRKAEHQID